MTQTLRDTLLQLWGTDKFPTSWIIGTDEPEVALQNIKEFAHKVLGGQNIPIDNNPDFRLIKRLETKFISVDQIRALQQFLYTTSAVSDNKFAVIFEADLMNLNSSNCCLKILEEAPRDSYLFLITSQAGSLIPTIKSRCHKLYLPFKAHLKVNDSYDDFLNLLLNSSAAQKIKYLQDISGKTGANAWEEFCQNSIALLSNLVKYTSKVNNDLRPEEMMYLSRLSIKSPELLAKRFESVQKMILDSYEFDLDKRHMGILLLECLI